MTSHVLKVAGYGYDDTIARTRAVVVWLIFASSFIVVFEPAPTDVIAIITLTFLFLHGVTIAPTVTPLLLLFVLFMLGYFSSFYANTPDEPGTLFLFSSLYILLTAFFIACFIGSRHHPQKKT